MKTLDKYTYNYAVEQAIALDSMGMFDAYKSWDYEPDTPDGIEIYSGASRMVFKLETLPGWVIKVDFENQKGYCKREADFYADAEELGIDYCFATTYRLYELSDGRVVILQEEVTVDEEAVTSSWFDYIRNSDEYGEDRDDPDDVWDYVYDMDTDERLCAIFGDDKRFNEISKFCHDNDINDLHEGNWGYTSNGILVIMDFAGYGVV